MVVLMVDNFKHEVGHVSTKHGYGGICFLQVNLKCRKIIHGLENDREQGKGKRRYWIFITNKKPWVRTKKGIMSRFTRKRKEEKPWILCRCPELHRPPHSLPHHCWPCGICHPSTHRLCTQRTLFLKRRLDPLGMNKWFVWSAYMCILYEVQLCACVHSIKVYVFVHRFPLICIYIHAFTVYTYVAN